ncbi:cell wall integrity and stress response component 1-like [Mizuhopecten yessoensis]|uniref:Mid2 domain-containing protein n=1 Tax=Mizuhopecten yessoensis TaxID=6573 RepID=A0A210QNG0_MIZYE|nr:cell wall integrity and stress response component 1-like [Mizuhopecten yessoensis]OWF50248.1 hypothetical protein KP79_PYT03517 [Mizuhopecten yessoensis]
MDDLYKFVIILIILTSTFLSISGCSSTEDVHIRSSAEVTGEFYSLALPQSSTKTSGQTSELFTDLTLQSTYGLFPTTTKKSPSSIVRSVSSTLSSYQGTMETQQSTTNSPNLPVGTSVRVNVTRMLTSLLLSTSSSSPLKSSSTHKSSDSSSSDFLQTTLTLVPSVSMTSASVVSTEDLSTSSLHTEVSQGEQSHSSPEKIAGIVVGAVCSVITVVVMVAAAFYFKRRQRRQSVVENIKVNYESEKFEDITDIDSDVITLTGSHYEKLQSANSSESQYTMIVRGAGNGQVTEEQVTSIEDDSSYVLPNEFCAVPGLRVKDNCMTNSYENTMFSLDIKDDFLPIQDENDYIKLSQGDFKGV